MIAYPDASLIIAALVQETGSQRAEAWLLDHASDLAISGWLDLEVASALAGKARHNAIAPDQFEAAIAFYERHSKGAAQRLSISDRAFGRAAGMIGAANGLRAGDALHLAIAEAHGATLFTLDGKQAKAGETVGVSVELV